MNQTDMRECQSMLGLYEKRTISLTECVRFISDKGYDVVTLTENFHDEARSMGTLTARCLPKGSSAPFTVISVTLRRV